VFLREWRSPARVMVTARRSAVGDSTDRIVQGYRSSTDHVVALTFIASYFGMVSCVACIACGLHSRRHGSA
jgi:hypothetical protein